MIPLRWDCLLVYTGCEPCADYLWVIFALCKCLQTILTGLTTCDYCVCDLLMHLLSFSAMNHVHPVDYISTGGDPCSDDLSVVYFQWDYATPSSSEQDFTTCYVFSVLVIPFVYSQYSFVKSNFLSQIWLFSISNKSDFLKQYALAF